MTALNESLNDVIASTLEELTGDVEVSEPETEEVLDVEDQSEVDEDDAAEADLDAELEDEVDEVDAEETDVEDADEDDSDDGESDAIELSDTDTVIIDGKEVLVKDALLMNADYTQKTQALSEERKQFEAEKAALQEEAETMRSLNEAWEYDESQVIATFLNNSEDVIDTATDAIVQIAQAGEIDANSFVVRSIVGLIQAELLEDELVQMLGFDAETVNKMKSEAKRDARIRKLEKSQRQQALETPQVDPVAAARAELQAQWNGVVSANSELADLDAEALEQVKVETAKLALDRGGLPLDAAYELLQVKKAKAQQAAAKKKAAANAAKRKTKVVSKPTNAASARPAGTPLSIEDAIAEAMNDLS